MKTIEVTLVKRKTNDGLFEIQDWVPIGQKYEADLDSIRLWDGYNSEKKVYWKNREMIRIFDGSPEGSWMPTELIEWEKWKRK